MIGEIRQNFTEASASVGLILATALIDWSGDYFYLVRRGVAMLRAFELKQRHPGFHGTSRGSTILVLCFFLAWILLLTLRGFSPATFPCPRTPVFPTYNFKGLPIHSNFKGVIITPKLE